MNFRVFSLNTHLFGGHWFLPKWKDSQRAEEIGEWLRAHKPDVVALQEVWDRRLFERSIATLEYDDDDDEHRPSFRFEGYGGKKDLIGINSGLAILSMLEGHTFEQEEFVSEDGMEAFATKGWVRATLVNQEANLTITVFNTHTQAAGRDVRRDQLEQLSDAVHAFRHANPTHTVFLVGDMNVPAGSDEYWDVLKPLFEPSREVPFESDTYSRLNPLSILFDKEGNSEQLDYIFFFQSLDGQTGIHLKHWEVVRILGKEKHARGITSREVSDHWGISATFSIYRK